MNMPLSLMRFHIANKRCHLSLWVPLFLLWSFIAAAVIVLLPIVILTALVFWCSGCGRRMLITGPVIFSCMCNLRGLEIDFQQCQERFLVSLK